ncbi:LysR family transcriptional regulator [Undibacterium umbellatum]|uniref:LysR family transcriptional regulator n=1 Tax=Undibacterium umbellatum TaxID=2762300 RepID=A0ABR6ZDR3_9BURK|nr:LysR family transcriptional regulator [Undibacterium umbellatum]MBC3909460.1 LysR family transcriptional regulator [Undibacterium umbellatum]
MEQYKRMALFAEVVTAGSLTSAARKLGMTPSAVSQHLRALESDLGLSLLHRSTRKLTLTEAGARYFEGCAAMVVAARSAEQALARHRDEPQGELRIAAPIGFGCMLAQALAPLQKNPKLSLCLLVDDSVVDLIDERIDIALRVGNLPDSSLVARRLGVMPAQICAAPSYLNEHGWPQHPQDLEHHVWLGGAATRNLQLTGPGKVTVDVKVPVRVRATQVTALHALCLAGWGISVAVSEDDHKALANGSLAPVLPDWKLPDMVLHAITPRRDEQPAKVRHALALLADHLTNYAT